MLTGACVYIYVCVYTYVWIAERIKCFPANVEKVQIAQIQVDKYAALSRQLNNGA